MGATDQPDEYGDFARTTENAVTSLKSISSTAETTDTPLRIRPKHVASQFSISERMVYEAIYRGDLPASRFGQRIWLIKPEDAEAWIEANSTSNIKLTEAGRVPTAELDNTPSLHHDSMK